MTSFLSNPLPPLYEKWVHTLLDATIPPETESTCQDCVMCLQKEETQPELISFHPKIKCCTYLPDLPNYLVGAILKSQEPELSFGRNTIIKRLEDPKTTTPLGLGRPEEIELRAATYQTQRFGKDLNLRCPHYLEESGQCGIWQYRSAVCTTWFCKHIRGVLGYQFWLSMQHFLRTIEEELSLWCLRHFEDLELEKLASLLLPELDQHAHPLGYTPLKSLRKEAWHENLWGSWQGKKAEFYGDCFRLVEPLTWIDVLELTSPKIELLSRVVQNSFKRLQEDKIPTPLKVGKFESAQMLDGILRVASYSPYDVLDLSLDLVQLLPYFDGKRTNREALDLISAKEGRTLEKSLLQTLVDFEILVPI